MTFKVELYSDGAVINDMIEMKEKGLVTGFTTNPSLMKAAGITDYVAFAKEALEKLGDMPISFEVFADDFETMKKEAEKISSLGDNVYVKIPIMNTKGESSIPLIKELSAQGLKLNVTALMTVEQVQEVVDAFAEGTDNIVSVFAGRLADVGIDPIPVVKKSVEICATKKGAKLLWASTREFFNIVEADRLGVAIITVPPTILSKLPNYNPEIDATSLSLKTVKIFNQDIEKLGFSIL